MEVQTSGEDRPVCFKLLVLRTALLLTGPGLLLMEAIIVGSCGPAVDQAALIAGGFVGMFAALIWAAAIALVVRVCVEPHGLYVGTCFGLGRRVRWEEVYDARPINFLGFRFLLVQVRERPQQSWVPLFLQRFDDFAESVFARAGLDHPVSAGLIAYRGW